MPGGRRSIRVLSYCSPKYGSADPDGQLLKTVREYLVNAEGRAREEPRVVLGRSDGRRRGYQPPRLPPGHVSTTTQAARRRPRRRPRRRARAERLAGSWAARILPAARRERTDHAQPERALRSVDGGGAEGQRAAIAGFLFMSTCAQRRAGEERHPAPPARARRRRDPARLSTVPRRPQRNGAGSGVEPVAHDWHAAPHRRRRAHGHLTAQLEAASAASPPSTVQARRLGQWPPHLAINGGGLCWTNRIRAPSDAPRWWSARSRARRAVRSARPVRV